MGYQYRSLAQSKRLNTLVALLNLSKEVKEDLIYKYTNGRTSTSRELGVGECSRLCDYLQDQLNKARDKKAIAQGAIQPAQDTKENRMRRKLFAIAHEMNWRKDGKADRDRLLAWVEKYGYLHKPMSKYTAEELPRLITQFENVLRAYHAEGKV